VVPNLQVGAEGAPDLPDAAFGDPDAALLSATVADLEALSRFDGEEAARRAQQAIDAARSLGLEELELRAQLVQADMVRRRGDIAQAGRVAQDVRRWAAHHGSDHLLARSHFLLAAVFQELGDLSVALEHAVQAVNSLTDDAVATVRIDHLSRLADCLGLQGDLGARERYDEVLQLAEQLGDLDRQLMVLNNRAYVETVAGDPQRALVLATELEALATEHGVPLHVGRLDTLARALIGVDRLAEAEEVLLRGSSPEWLDASDDGDAGADFLLTLAETQRRLGRVAQAQQTLDECIRRCELYGLTSIRVRARREQAELHAAGADFQAAFEEHKLYSQEALDLQSAQRDARARALQAMYETTEARRQSRRYRELSLRDPLTGLYNRRYVDEQFTRLLGDVAGTEPGRGPVVSVALLDLDHFKRVNDTFSHDVGDQVLRIVGGLLQPPGSEPLVGGAGSFAARMGGEEFLLVLVGADRAEAACALEEVRQAISAHPWSEVADGLAVTVSVGVASSVGVADPAPSELLGRADAHLYRAKSNGRDRVVTDLD
jgi:two-component system, cell cycle response regulator